jgi:hypothetical protein
MLKDVVHLFTIMRQMVKFGKGMQFLAVVREHNWKSPAA